MIVVGVRYGNGRRDVGKVEGEDGVNRSGVSAIEVQPMTESSSLMSMGKFFG